MDDPFWRQYKIDHVCIDRILRHLIETCRMMMLRKCNTTLLFDGLESKCAVFSCTGQDNTDSLTLMNFSKRVKKKVDGQIVITFRWSLRQVQYSIICREMFVGRNYINIIWLHMYIISNLMDRNQGEPLK